MPDSIKREAAAVYPAELVDGADVSVLPDEVFMRYQEIKIAGEGCSSNFRFLIYADGRFYLQENRGEDCASRPAGTRFNKPIDSEPTQILDGAALDSIREALVKNRFSELPQVILAEGKVFDGAVKIMEIRSATGIKWVISVHNASKALENIIEVVWAQL